MGQRSRGLGLESSFCFIFLLVFKCTVQRLWFSLGIWESERNARAKRGKLLYERIGFYFFWLKGEIGLVWAWLGQAPGFGLWLEGFLKIASCYEPLFSLLSHFLSPIIQTFLFVLMCHVSVICLDFSWLLFVRLYKTKQTRLFHRGRWINGNGNGYLHIHASCGLFVLRRDVLYSLCCEGETEWGGKDSWSWRYSLITFERDGI